MVFSVGSLMELSIPDYGLECTVKGHFYFYIAEISACNKKSTVYLAASKENDDELYISIPKYVGEEVRGSKGPFCGGYIGGTFAFDGMSAVISGTVRRENDDLIFSKVETVVLSKGDKEITVHITEL